MCASVRSYRHLYACGNASTRVTSAFKSSVPLGAHVRKIDTPGAGTYDPNDGNLGLSMTRSQSTLSKDGHSMFAGGVQQRKALGDTKRTGEHIGPGTYDLRGHTIHGRMVSSTNPRLPGFASSAPRADDYEYDD